jgi:hypothetical protein
MPEEKIDTTFQSPKNFEDFLRKYIGLPEDQIRPCIEQAKEWAVLLVKFLDEDGKDKTLFDTVVLATATWMVRDSLIKLYSDTVRALEAAQQGKLETVEDKPPCT